MNSISFDIDRDLSEMVSEHAAKAGMTGSAWIASRLAEWIETERYVDEMRAAVASFHSTLNEYFPE